jgi:hypothetical protein
VDDDVHAEGERERNPEQHHRSQRLAGPRELVLFGLLQTRAMVLVPQLAQDERDPQHRREQDELLAQGVKAPEVEVQGRDQVGGMPEADPDSVEHIAVDAVVVTEVGKPGEPDHEHRAQDRGREPEQRQPDRAAHPSSS